MPSRRGVAGRLARPGAAVRTTRVRPHPLGMRGETFDGETPSEAAPLFVGLRGTWRATSLLEGLLDPDTLAAIASIVIIDLVLSGDNAVVIGMAASQLPGDQRRKAILFGAAGAIGLRVLFTAMVAILLGVPLLQLGGGLLL